MTLADGGRSPEPPARPDGHVGTRLCQGTAAPVPCLVRTAGNSWAQGSQGELRSPFPPRGDPIIHGAPVPVPVSRARGHQPRGCPSSELPGLAACSAPRPPPAPEASTCGLNLSTGKSKPRLLSLTEGFRVLAPCCACSGVTAQPSKQQALSQVPPFLNSPLPKKNKPIFLSSQPCFTAHPQSLSCPRGHSCRIPGSCQTLPGGADPAALAASCVFSSQFGASPARREPESHGSLKVTAGLIDRRPGRIKAARPRPPPRANPQHPRAAIVPLPAARWSRQPPPGTIEGPFGNQCGKLPEKQVKEGEGNKATSRPSGAPGEGSTLAARPGHLLDEIRV